MSTTRAAARTRIKFCGFSREQDIEAAVALGVDAIGLIVVPASPRALTVERAAALRRHFPPLVSAVLLIQDPEADWLARACAAIAPDLLQFHGAESVQICTQPGLRYLKAVSMAGFDTDPGAVRSVIQAHRGTAAGWVLDSHRVGGLGGSGRTFDWSRLPELDLPLVLAGGLNADNVAEAVRSVRPFAVDVAGGIESAPGIKDAQRMAEFVRAVRRADLDRPASGDPGDVDTRNSESFNQAGAT